MDIYDTRRGNLAILIKVMNLSYGAFGKLVGYNGAYIGQLINRTRRSKGGEALVTDKVVGKVLAALKGKKTGPYEVDRTWFDIEQSFSQPLLAAIEEREVKEAPLRTVETAVRDTPPSILIEDEKFPDHLSSTWPYMTDEQRAAIRYLEASFRKKRANAK